MILSHGANAPAVTGSAAQVPNHVHGVWGVATGPSLARLEYETLMAHVWALGYASVLLLATNLLLALGVLALWDDRLWAARVATNPQIDEPIGQSSVGGVLI